MFSFFKNILIPVDFSINTEVAVKKAMELAGENTTIHLLHVQFAGSRLAIGLGGSWINTIAIPDYETIEQNLRQWKRSIEESAEGARVCIWNITNNSIQKSIERKARQLQVDLIIIGKHSYHSWFPFLNTIIPSQVAQATAIAVLTVKPGAIHNKVRTMIVPVSGRSASHKKEIISALCRKFKLKIHLVTFRDGNASSHIDASRFLQLYQWLKTSTHCQVEHEILRGQNKVKSILTYAKKVDADILLVHSETETKIGWLNKHISDVLPPTSKLQVLAVR